MAIELPKLMLDDSESDGPAEPVMDYVISWCVRWAQKDLSSEKPILHRQCKKLLCRLLGFDTDENIEFNKVKVWKQCKRIDLWIELCLTHNGIHENHAILVEDKYYSKQHLVKDSDGIYRNQLIVYKKKFDEYYDSNKLDYLCHYALVTCIKRDDPKFDEFYGCVEKEEKYKDYIVMDYYELRGDCTEETESDIYNEFWLNW